MKAVCSVEKKVRLLEKMRFKMNRASLEKTVIKKVGVSLIPCSCHALFSTQESSLSFIEWPGAIFIKKEETEIKI
ncbi:MAG: hypothetical protein EA360_10745 [Balneolaceae bacterium]|nr:MAG: hypothetical protein EA360_10745 [Balneolaceae bacterium]